MNFDYNQEQMDIKQMVRDFATSEILPGAYERDQTSKFPFDLCKKMGELGLMGMSVATEHGGSQMDLLTIASVMEEVAKCDGSLALTLASHNGLACGHIQLAGSKQLKEKYLPALASGQKLGAWCLTESGSGSDALAMKTTAVKQGDEWVINGSKNFITQGSVADVYVILAFTDPSKKAKGVSAFLACKGSKGLIVGKKEDKMGLRASDTASLVFENLRVPKENMIGELGQGFVDALKILDRGRVVIGAMALGLGQGALNEAVKYSKERTAFGKPISEFQAISGMIADSAMELEAARCLIQRAAWMHDQKQYAKKESSMAKLLASEAAWKACNKALQIHGGYGYVKEYAVERMFRDVKLCEIGEGTSQVQREVIASQILS